MAKNSISKISNAFSTGGGGVNFEQQIQAMFLLSLLIDGFCPAMNEQTKKVHFQAMEIGKYVIKKNCLINVKIRCLTIQSDGC